MALGFMVNTKMGIAEKIKLYITSCLLTLLSFILMLIVAVVGIIGWLGVAWFVYRKKRDEILKTRKEKTIHMYSLDN